GIRYEGGSATNGRITDSNISSTTGGQAILLYNGANYNTINNVNVSNPNYIAIDLQANIIGTVIANSTLSSNGGLYGIRVYGSSHNNTITNTSVTTAGATHGVYVTSSSANVSIDCQDKSIIGTNTTSTYGVYSDSFNTTIRNCQISNFESGIKIDSTTSATVRNNTVSNITGANGYGILLCNSASSLVTNNTVNSSGPAYTSIGLSCGGPINDNTVSNNIVYAYSEAYGAIYLSLGANNNLISNNSITAIGTHGIGITYGTNNNNTLRNNTISISGSYSGIYNGLAATNLTIDCAGATITGNNSSNSYGIYSNGFNTTIQNCNILYFANGIYFQGAANGSVQDSNVTNNTETGVKILASNYTSLSSSYVCFNAMDIDNSGTGNTGSNDRCDSFLDWSENGRSGCERACTTLWHRLYGNVSGLITLGNSSLYPYLYNWTTSNATNVYITDYDSSPSWYQLQAIGKNTSNGSASNDFVELDIALNATSYADNINVSFSTDGSAPKETRNYTIWGKLVENVPIANSSAFNSSFKTGVLWDMSGGGSEYSNVTKQTTVWIAKVNKSATDVYGTYDFLIEIPYTLSYYQAGNNLVSLYAELE
ncbi:TPA: hypothetical protein HA243_04855, partial [Candidatus Micrarchaeota archaeon]|nr:hypothetical protein [Candidatus Micrarchaeota archaeon]